MISWSVKTWIRGVRERLSGSAGDERGAVAVVFAVSLVLLAPLVVGVVDIYMSSSQRSRLQDALDAAALYTARSTASTASAIETTGRRALMANLSASDQARLISSTFVLNESTVVATAELSPQSIASNLWNHGNLKASTNVVRASSNLEVAVVLDITGSMSGDMASLRSAATKLVDIVVQDVQTPYYSKLAIVPYANAVNVGSDLIDDVRGAMEDAVEIQGADRSRPVFIDADEHGYSDGDEIYIDGVRGMTELNGNTYEVDDATTNTFTLNTTSGYNVDGRDYSRFKNGNDPKAHCTEYGCDYYRFRSASNSTRIYKASTTCVTERTGGHKYDDVSPATAKVGFLYTSSQNDCPDVPVVPLSTNKTALKAVITDLDDGGATAGHIGLAWGWYMVSPNFASVWPDASSGGAAYGTDDLLKVVVLMTDGEFNTAYCNGVLADDSSNGSNSSQIDCNAQNDDSTDQAEALCTAMKAKGIIIYTVGFGIWDGSSAARLMSHCATSAKHQYMPSSGTDLEDAFQAIGQDINSLRLSH